MYLYKSFIYNQIKFISPALPCYIIKPSPDFHFVNIQQGCKLNKGCWITKETVWILKEIYFKSLYFPRVGTPRSCPYLLGFNSLFVYFHFFFLLILPNKLDIKKSLNEGQREHGLIVTILNSQWCFMRWFLSRYSPWSLLFTCLFVNAFYGYKY